MPSRKDKAWDKATPIRSKDPKTWGKDPYGNKIRYGSYGTEGEYGWELDHTKPESKGGTDNPRNIQPVYWEENRKKSDKYPYKKR